jgi:transposase InsO family protein
MNVLWVADATYIPTDEGFLYLAVVLDVFSRRIVGWAMSNHLYTELMLRALDMALQQRHHDGVILHSDQGCQYTSIAFGRRCREAGVQPSMGTAGDAYDTQSKIRLERRSDLTQPMIGRAAFALTCRLDSTFPERCRAQRL